MKVIRGLAQTLSFLGSTHRAGVYLMGHHIDGAGGLLPSSSGTWLNLQDEITVEPIIVWTLIAKARQAASNLDMFAPGRASRIPQPRPKV